MTLTWTRISKGINHCAIAFVVHNVHFFHHRFIVHFKQQMQLNLIVHFFHTRAPPHCIVAIKFFLRDVRRLTSGLKTVFGQMRNLRDAVGVAVQTVDIFVANERNKFVTIRMSLDHQHLPW